MRRRLARVVEVVVVVGLLPLWGMVLGVMAVVVLVGMGRPVVFRQERAGKNGRAFELLKFRTMREGEGSDAERLTRFGRWLRSTSLDELPQLFNVLRGEMALVGPRPLPVRYVERYSERQRRRLEVRPGITGWAQVKGRNRVGWEERFELDVWYVENRGWFLDVRIVMMTIFKMFRREGISGEGEATMAEFRGEER